MTGDLTVIGPDEWRDAAETVRTLELALADEAPNAGRRRAEYVALTTALHNAALALEHMAGRCHRPDYPEVRRTR